MFRIWIYDKKTGKEFEKVFYDYKKYKAYKCRVEHSKHLVITMIIEDDL